MRQAKLVDLGRLVESAPVPAPGTERRPGVNGGSREKIVQMVQTIFGNSAMESALYGWW